MGGFGSGNRCRFGARSCLDDNIALDIRWLRRKGLLVAGQSRNIQWLRNGEETDDINVSVGDDLIRLSYRLQIGGGEWKSVELSVALDYTGCNYGGQRAWMLCPICSQRCAKLYLAVPHFACRKCHNLPYQSQNESRSDRMVRKARNIRYKLGADASLVEPVSKKPKGMHWKTFNRLMAREKWANQESWIESALWLDKNYGVLKRNNATLPNRTPPPV